MKSPSENHRDVVIIGAGHNGLVAAAFLAKAGLDVLVRFRLDARHEERRRHAGLVLRISSRHRGDPAAVSAFAAVREIPSWRWWGNHFTGGRGVRRGMENRSRSRSRNRSPAGMIWRIISLHLRSVFTGAPTPKQVLAPTGRNSGCFLRGKGGNRARRKK